MRILFVLLPLALLSACAGPPAAPGTDESIDNQTPPASFENPYAPQAGDDSLVAGPVYLESAELVTLESYPPQFRLILVGHLPTPCHRLRVSIAPPDSENRIQVRAYALTDPNEICIQVLEPFEVNLGSGSFPAGHYRLEVNQEFVVEFDA